MERMLHAKTVEEQLKCMRQVKLYEEGLTLPGV